MLIYQANGFMSAQVSVGNPRRFADDDWLKAPTEDAADAWRNYLGYWGTFQIDADRNTVTHCVEGSSFANWIGTKQVRKFHFDRPDRLILSAEYEDGRYTLTWRRKSA
jgi:Lipocalin-like domain